MNPLRVLVVDDDPDIRQALVEVLQAENYRVTAARDGAEGLRLAHEHRPEVITLDLMMPVMDGWRFRILQKSEPSLRDIPVVVVSASGLIREIDAAAFVPKPCHVKDLVAAVNKHGRRYRKEHGHAV